MAIKYRNILALILFALIITVAHGDDNGPVDDGSNDDGSDDDGSNDDGSDDDGSNDDGSDDDDGSSGGQGGSYIIRHFNRSSFPTDFIFGAATSAFQIEGGSDRRGTNIWDVFIENNPELIANKSDAKVAADSYHRFKEDVSLLSGLGFDAYRFSISWTRLLPTGRISGGINGDGVRYYHALIDEIISKGMIPFATIFHWDLPQALEDEYKGFLSEKIVEDFARYSELCFFLFGKKVKHWITLNEPWSYTTLGYAYGAFPPNRCSKSDTLKGSGNSGFSVGRFASYNSQDGCKYGNSGTEPYIVTHHMLLAHATAVKIYRENYQKYQGGQIGITLVTQWFEPYNPKMKTDVDAAARSLAFMFGWYMDPLFTGAYPTEMVTYVDGDRLPSFKDHEAKIVKGSYDFIGLNYYTAEYSQDIPCDKSQQNYLTDPCVNPNKTRNGKPIGGKTGADWLYVYPKGFHELLVYIKDKYNNPPIYVTENGVCRDNRGPRPHDMLRVNYHRGHLMKLRFCLNRKDVNVKGYFVWSLMDNFEWLDGYFVNFGLVRIDYDNKSLNRSCKDSASWFNVFLNKDGGSNEAQICKLFPSSEN